jgi:hypothetical protein
MLEGIRYRFIFWEEDPWIFGDSGVTLALGTNTDWHSSVLLSSYCWLSTCFRVISEKEYTKRRVGNLLPTRLACQAATYGFGVRFG